jgi:hypothetical protein
VDGKSLIVYPIIFYDHLLTNFCIGILRSSRSARLFRSHALCPSSIWEASFSTRRRALEHEHPELLWPVCKMRAYGSWRGPANMVRVPFSETLGWSWGGLVKETSRSDIQIKAYIW